MVDYPKLGVKKRGEVFAWKPRYGHKKEGKLSPVSPLLPVIYSNQGTKQKEILLSRIGVFISVGAVRIAEQANRNFSALTGVKDFLSFLQTSSNLMPGLTREPDLTKPLDSGVCMNDGSV